DACASSNWHSRRCKTSSFVLLVRGKTPMRKIIVVAVREYLAAVRTKAFIIGLLIMPIMMCGSIVVQALLRNFRDTSEKKFAVIDRTPEEVLWPTVLKTVEAYNQTTVKDGKQTLPTFALERQKPPRDDAELEKMRVELSARVKAGKLSGILEIGPEA